MRQRSVLVDRHRLMDTSRRSSTITLMVIPNGTIVREHGDGEAEAIAVGDAKSPTALLSRLARGPHDCICRQFAAVHESGAGTSPKSLSHRIKSVSYYVQETARERPTSPTKCPPLTQTCPRQHAYAATQHASRAALRAFPAVYLVGVQADEQPIAREEGLQLLCVKSGIRRKNEGSFVD